MIRVEDIKRYNRCKILYHHEKSTIASSFPLTAVYLNFLKLKPTNTPTLLANTLLQYRNLEAHVPLLKKRNGSWILSIPLYSSKELYFYTKELEFIYYIAYKKNMYISNIEVMVCNQDEHKPLFTLLWSDVKKRLQISPNIIKKYDKIVASLNQELNDQPTFEQKCLSKKRCQELENCFGLNHNSIIYYKGLKNDHKLQKSLDEEITIQTKTHNLYEYAQTQAVANGKYINEQKLTQFLNNIVEPIVYIDFEWDYELDTKTRQRRDKVFCYSMHIEQQKTLKYYSDFHFDEIQLIESLLQKMPENGSIIAFDAMGGENQQFKRMIKQYPQYAEKIKELLKRVVDIAIVFKEGYYYDNRLKGSHSLKNIMKILPLQQTSEINEATTAVATYRSLKGQYNKKKIAKILKYNYYDTYALYLIKKLLKKAIKK